MREEVHIFDYWRRRHSEIQVVELTGYVRDQTNFVGFVSTQLIHAVSLNTWVFLKKYN